jgi:deoxyribose-phosphate aldolase
MNLTEILSLQAQYEHELPPFPEGGQLQNPDLAACIDHTLLKPDATPAQVIQLCQEARQYRFASVCVNGLYVPLAAQQLQGSPVAVCTVVGFPLGAMPTSVKVHETHQALQDGASEIDMVLPIGLLKAGQADAVLADIQTIVNEAHLHQAIVKVILEMAYLTHREKILACLLCKAAQADFVKTSTGFAPSGATPEDVRLMRRIVGPISEMGVKAAGGVRSLADARTMLEAGANRLGASASVKIIQELS